MISFVRLYYSLYESLYNYFIYDFYMSFYGFVSFLFYFMFCIIFWILVYKKVDFNDAVSEILTQKFEYFLCQNRYFIMHQRCQRVGRDRSFFQGLSSTLVPMWLSSCGCRCFPLHLIELVQLRAQIKPIALLCYLVPWMAALVVLHLLMNSHFVGYSHYKENLLMLLPMLLA